MQKAVTKASQLIHQWKNDCYVFGLDVLDQACAGIRAFGATALVVSHTDRYRDVLDRVMAALKEAQVTVLAIAPGVRPNAPREDVYRIESYILHHDPDMVIVIGGGSAIDAVKAANVLATLGKEVTPEIDHYFGTGIVTGELAHTDRKLKPLIAVQTSASSAAHLTKYANITDVVAGQKKLIVDMTIVPSLAIFDYGVTVSMPLSVTIDGALDAIAHTFEVFCSADESSYDRLSEIAETAIELVVTHAPTLVADPTDRLARQAIGLASDLGGYAIMVGGTSGALLTSFSLVDIVAHGTACGIMNPYYAVYFGKAIQRQLHRIGEIFRRHGYIDVDLASLAGRELSLAVAQGMIAFSRLIGAPTTLAEIPGFTEDHIRRAVQAAQDPQLAMKLQNMSVPMTADEVETYMEPILRAAATGDMSIIREK